MYYSTAHSVDVYKVPAYNDSMYAYPTFRVEAPSDILATQLESTKQMLLVGCKFHTNSKHSSTMTSTVLSKSSLNSGRYSSMCLVIRCIGIYSAIHAACFPGSTQCVFEPIKHAIISIPRRLNSLASPNINSASR